MGRNISAYLQHKRNEELDPPYLGCVGNENIPFLELSNEDIRRMNEEMYALEVRGVLNALYEQFKPQTSK